MTQPTKPLKPTNPKSEHGQARSAEALRANLLKRKAQMRARAGQEPKASQPSKDDEAG